MKQKVTIGLMGHSFHCSNLGVGALALSECAILQKVSDELGAELEVICFESGWSEECYINATPTKVRQLYYTYSPKMIGEFKKCDLILDVTGGDSFSDIYGQKIFIAGMIFKWYAILSGRKVVLAPQTIGPFHRRMNRILADFYMNYVKRIFLRDKLSLEILSKQNKLKASCLADIAFKLPYQKGEKKEKYAGFNVSGLLYDSANSLVNREGFSYAELCDRIIQLLLEYNYKIVLISHVIGNETEIEDNDYCASLLIKQKYPQLEIAPVFRNPIEAKNYISQMEVFLGARMHAVIAAVSSGVPAIPIAYSRKFKGVFEPLGYDVTLDATTMATTQMIDSIRYYLDNIDVLKEKCDTIPGRADELLIVYEQYLKNEISEIMKRG